MNLLRYLREPRKKPREAFRRAKVESSSEGGRGVQGLRKGGCRVEERWVTIDRVGL